MQMQNIPRSQRRDPIRPGHRLKIKINVRPANMSIPGSRTLAKNGAQDVIIHHLDLAMVEAMVEKDQAVWPQAEAIVARKVAEHIARVTGGEMAVILETSPEEWPDDWSKAANAFVGSTVSGTFRELTGHDHLPLLSVEVLEEMPGEMGQDFQMAAQIAKAMAAAQGGSADTTVLEAKVAELTAQVEALLANQAEAPKKRR